MFLLTTAKEEIYGKGTRACLYDASLSYLHCSFHMDQGCIQPSAFPWSPYVRTKSFNFISLQREKWRTSRYQ